ncbi:hypothetical protein A0H76_505 [Hepatospora eriocheir]|uniref:Uncharacterized protein n=1 Tax=Hepatospora eriocheir TaxID=1081669 RepID=A0A1X0QLD8_9MICR|nr:hypothetical protein A0H76_505 [Hepatospora eriocheir]
MKITEFNYKTENCSLVSPITDIIQYKSKIYYSQNNNIKSLTDNTIFVFDFRIVKLKVILDHFIVIGTHDISILYDDLWINKKYDYFIADCNLNYVLLYNKKIYNLQSNELICELPLKSIIKANFNNESLNVCSYDKYYLIDIKDFSLNEFDNRGRVFDLIENNNNIYHASEDRTIKINNEVKIQEYRNYFFKLLVFENELHTLNRDGYYRVYDLKTLKELVKIYFFENSLSTISVFNNNTYLGFNNGMILSFNITDKIIKNILPTPSLIKNTSSLSKVCCYYKNNSFLIFGNKKGFISINDKVYKLTDCAIKNIEMNEKLVIVLNHRNESILFNLSDETVLYKTQNSFNRIFDKIDIVNLFPYFNFSSYMEISDEFTFIGNLTGHLFLLKNNSVVDVLKLNGSIESIYKDIITTSIGYVYSIKLYKERIFIEKYKKYNFRIITSIYSENNFIISLSNGSVYLNNQLLFNFNSTISSLCYKNNILYFSSLDTFYKYYNNEIIKVCNIEGYVYKTVVYKSTILLSCDSHKIYVVENDIVKNLKIHTNRIVDLHIKNNLLYTLSYDKTIKVVDLNSFKVIKEYKHSLFHPYKIVVTDKIIIIGNFIETLLIN